MKWATVRKYLVAALVPVIPAVAHFLGVSPVHITDNAAWYELIVGEAIAFGVYLAPNATKND